jgi:succinate dehydrogenase flavin-adding protein (antitoxin of CptAB toxin-antitoxin module)
MSRFRAMRREHRELADLIYDRHYEDGIAKMHEDNLSDEAFRKLIKKQYYDIISIIEEGFC